VVVIVKEATMQTINDADLDAALLAQREQADEVPATLFSVPELRIIAYASFAVAAASLAALIKVLLS
jgi:hypothetical protein